MMRTFLGRIGLPLSALLLVSGPTLAAQCGDSDDPFGAFYGQQGVGKQWHVSLVGPDHEDHGLHLIEGDSFILRVDSDCEVMMIPDTLLGQRWGAAHQHFGRESKALGDQTISNELCTTMGLGHDHATSGAIIARPHLVRLRMIEGSGGNRIEIQYGHRSSMGDSCSNDGLLDSIHGGTAHAEH